jgi:hypothetical protein
LLNKNELQQLDAEGLSEEEYYQIRETLLAIKEMDSELEFQSEHVKNKLLDVFDEGAQKQARIIVFPMWAKLTLLAAACIALGLFLFNPNSTIYNTTNEVASNSQSSANEDQLINNTSSESNTVSTDQTPIIDNTSNKVLSVVIFNCCNTVLPIKHLIPLYFKQSVVTHKQPNQDFPAPAEPPYKTIFVLSSIKSFHA